MNENNKNEEFKVEVDKEELKNQTKETVNQVKETVKNINFKEDAKATKGFVLKMIQNPISTIKEVVEGKENHFTIAIIFLICFIVIYGVLGLLNKDLIKGILSPIILVLSMTISIVLFGGKDKKSMPTIITGVTISIVPLLVAYVIGILSEILGNPELLVGLYNGIKIAATALYAVLAYFAINGLITTETEENKSFRKYSIIMIVSYAIVAIFEVLNLYVVL